MSVTFCHELLSVKHILTNLTTVLCTYEDVFNHSPIRSILDFINHVNLFDEL